MPKICQCDFLLWVWARVRPFKLKRNLRPFLFVRMLSRLQLWLWKHFFCLFVCFITVSGHCSARHQLCLCVLLVLHMSSPGTWGLREGFHGSCNFFCPSLRSCGAPALSLTQKRLLAYCGSPLCYLQSPSLQFCFKKWCDRKAGCRQIWQSCQVFQKDKSSEDHHNAPCPSSKKLSYLETSVLMMYNMEDD